MTNCTELDGYTKPPMCIQLCARKVTINGINGERLKVAKKAVCGTSNQEVCLNYVFSSPPQPVPRFPEPCANFRLLRLQLYGFKRSQSRVFIVCLWNQVIDSSEFFLMTPQGLPSNLYGFELRFRQKKYPGDEDIVRCPIKRTACDYRGDFLLGCKAALDDT